MTGSLTVKNGKYYAVLNIYENGKRKKKWICSDLPEKGNKRKAEQFLRKKLAEYERAAGIVKSDILFSEYVKIWLEQIARTVDNVTLQGYRTLANGHIIPYFEKLQTELQAVTAKTIQQYMDEKYKSGRLDGKGGLSTRSLQLHKNILRQTLEMAVQNQLIPANPCQNISLPSGQKYESSFYTERQLLELCRCLADDPLLPLVKITALYGLRRSELLGLKWDSINFESETMTIKHTVAKVTEVVEKDKTKNASSHRMFPLTEEAMQIFQQAKEQETQNRLAFGNSYIENEYVFKWPDGHTYSPDYISHRFKTLLKKHGLPHIRFHELRHSCASILISMGFTLKDVQDWLGHSDIKMTANIYSHLDNARKANIAASLADKLNATSGR